MRVCRPWSPGSQIGLSVALAGNVKTVGEMPEGTIICNVEEVRRTDTCLGVAGPAGNHGL